MELLVLGLLALIAVQAEEVSTEQTDGILVVRKLFQTIVHVGDYAT